MTRLPLLLGLLGELDHQDRVLRREAHRRQQADLEIDVVLQPAQRHREDRADQAERDDQQHRDRDRPALVERGEAQEHDEQRERVEQAAPGPTTAAPDRTARPGDARARDLRRRARSISSIASPELTPGAGWPWISKAGTPLKRVRLLGAVSQPASAKEENGAISPFDRADVPLAEISRVGAVRRIALDIDALDAALIDEVVDVAAAPGGRERGVDVALVEPERGQLLLVSMSILSVGDVGQGR